jgi:two-component system, LytTR family, sensor kinase
MDSMSPPRKARFWLILACWTALALLFGAQIQLINTRVLGGSGSWSEALAWSFSYWYAWAALAPLVVWLSRLLLREGTGFLVSLQLHLPACLLVSFAHLAVLLIVTRASHISVEPLRAVYAVHMQWNLILYWVLVGATHALHYYDRFRERELRATQLEAELAQSQLHRLKMQLQPHFLFNALNAISTLIETDPDAADRMLSQLASLLRESLRADAPHEVSLREELSFLDRYLEIEKTRFADRLRVSFEVDPGALDARVPSLLLQPLVENAIRHGVSRRADGGRVDVRAWRENGSLRLEVKDNGPGLPETANQSGIGLANTRARLERLHGEDYRFELANLPGGGALAAVRLPFTETSPAVS